MSGSPSDELGAVHRDGTILVRQGEHGDRMYVIQEGRAEVILEQDGCERLLTVLGPGDLFGEMAIIDGEVRSATVRAVGELRVLTVDKRTFLRRIHEDPSIAYRIVQKMARRIRELSARVAESDEAG